MTDANQPQHLPRAQQRVMEERERIRAEQDAFRAFSERVSTLTPESPARAGETQQNGALVFSQTTQSTRLGRVREAYRETVMSVDHYSEDYDETLAVNISEELNEELSHAITASQQFTQPLKNALLEASKLAAENRQRYLVTLDQEASTLKDAKAALELFEEKRRAIAPEDTGRVCSYDELVIRWEGLRRLDPKYDYICSERQSQIQRRRTNAEFPSNMPTLCGYLYDELSVTHPVLAESMNRLERVRSDRQCTLSLLTQLD